MEMNMRTGQKYRKRLISNQTSPVWLFYVSLHSYPEEAAPPEALQNSHTQEINRPKPIYGFRADPNRHCIVAEAGYLN